MKTIIFLLFLLVGVSSCEKLPVESMYRRQIVKEKTRDLYRGSTIYRLSYTDKTHETVGFGVYSNYEVGDTICWEQNGLYWHAVNCE